jgi:AraC-like DNA-binding protein
VHRPLENFVLVESAGADEMRNCLADLYGEVRPGSRSGQASVGGRVHSRTIGDLTISYVSCAEPVGLEFTCSDSMFLVWLSCSGRSVVEAGPRRVLVSELRGFVSNPGSNAEMRWSRDCAQLLVGIDRSAAQRCLSDLLGEALPVPLVFESAFNATCQPLNAWYDAVTLYVNSLAGADGVLGHQAVADSWERALVTTFLVSHRHNYWDVLGESAPLVPSRTIREATQLIDSQPGRQHSVSSLAGAVGVSVRALERVFKRHLGTTPGLYLRDVRLRRAQADLEVSGPDVVTVAEVARRHGFFHFGRFAATYRNRFGEAPSRTLRRVGKMFR